MPSVLTLTGFLMEPGWRRGLLEGGELIELQAIQMGVIKHLRYYGVDELGQYMETVYLSATVH